MRIRVRGPEGQSTVILDDSATVDNLRTQITDKTGLTAFDVKYGYPNLKPLELEGYSGSQKVTEIGIKLNGEQLIVTRQEGAPSQHPVARILLEHQLLHLGIQIALFLYRASHMRTSQMIPQRYRHPTTRAPSCSVSCPMIIHVSSAR